MNPEFDRERNPIVLLHDARPGRERLKRFGDLRRTIRADTPEDVPAALDAVAKEQATGHHVAGYFSYELGYLLEGRLQPLLWQERTVPLLWFGVFGEVQELVGDNIAQCLQSELRGYAGPLEHEWDFEAYRSRFDQTRRLIDAGDTYQINLSFRSRFRFMGDPFALYADLSPVSGVAHGAFIDDGARCILSFSPELFFALDADGRITARPMKGTAPRLSDVDADIRQKEQLEAGEKNRAENLMIVDLLRNDLGRIAELGSVNVKDIFMVETYPTVYQMVSTVTAKLEAETGPQALVKSLFPCGSVTGAPKIRAMEIIRELEMSPRGVYCGSIGYFAPDRSALFNVAIRTMTISNGTGELGIGSAIVHDSRAQDEFEECLLKARYYDDQRKPVTLIETLRHEPGKGFARLELHLARMAGSAEAFGIGFDQNRAKSILNEEAAHKDEVLRVRLTLDEQGKLECTSAPLGQPMLSWRFSISPIRVRSDDVLLRYKTDRREFQEHEYRKAVSDGLDEIVFANERGELTEGSRTNLFVKLDGRMVTPDLSSGLLNGCLRQEMLDSGACQEMVLQEGDLDKAQEIFLGNSLRELIPATFVRPLKSEGG